MSILIITSGHIARVLMEMIGSDEIEERGYLFTVEDSFDSDLAIRSFCLQRFDISLRLEDFPEIKKIIFLSIENRYFFNTLGILEGILLKPP